MSNFMDTTLTRAEMKRITGGSYMCYYFVRWTNSAYGQTYEESEYIVASCALTSSYQCEAAIQQQCGQAHMQGVKCSTPHCV
jgi:hypothetical protein